ncbi:MAG: outer membrane protein assembly factor BamE [Oxalobacter sp.]|nr:MAG: outer membrane protein assembly factor BamE [Oxalobacter sp.]
MSLFHKRSRFSWRHAAVLSSVIAVATALSACSSTPEPQVETISPSGAVMDSKNTPPPAPKRWFGIFTPYKIDIQQGNFVSQEMASKLREGMTKEQVRFLLGAPLLNDMFHAERWDYIFRLLKGDGTLTANRLTVFFSDNRLARFESTPLPNEAEYLLHMSGKTPKQEKDKAQKKDQDKNKS